MKNGYGVLIKKEPKSIYEGFWENNNKKLGI